MPTLFVYMLGMASMLASDVLVTKFMTETDIALWADMRSLFGILATLVTLGIEMVFIRAPGSSRLLLRMVLVQAVFLSLPLGFLVHQLGYLSGPWSGVLLAWGAASTMAQGQFFRSHGAFFGSQLSQQMWRVVILILLLTFLYFQIATAWPIDLLAGAILFGISLFGWAFVLSSRYGREHSEDPSKSGHFYAISIRFLITNVILNVAVFGEQMIVNGLGTNRQASIFFTHVTYFLLPASLLTAFIGFRLGPWLRDNPDQFEAILSRYNFLIYAGTILIVALAHFVGWIGWLIISPSAGEPLPLLQIALFLSAVLRTYYVIPSAYNGIFGAPREHDILIVGQIILLLALAVGIYSFYGAIDIVFLVAGLGIANWVGRTLIYDHVMRLASKHRQARANEVATAKV